ncbi:MAG: proton-conducting transporter membrane subunit [Pirellulaceae bacterium]
MSGYCLLVAAPPVLLMAGGLISSRWANRHTRWMRRWTLLSTAVALALSAAAAVSLVVHGPLDAALLTLECPVPLNLGVYFDSLSAVMLVLINFIGLIIARYSVRYLDGEPTQGRFLRWMLFTLGAVLSLVVSRNLVMFTAAWMLTSLGLHQLLTHYADRPWAVWAARKKFLISRLGDAMLLAALALTWHCFGSFDYGEVFAASAALQETPADASPLVPLIGMLFVFGAMTKSAQFPFHSWLPDTMETPTPVSALMHAGIINAGGFLILRLSPLVSLSPLSLDLLALGGAFTALLGGLVMLTQTSVKRSLAYSTIAQMGFMMLQCGLGAYSAALLHIVAHSLYKAHAFLSSGSVLDAAAARKTDLQSVLHGPRALAALPAALAASLGAVGVAAWLLPIDPSSKPGAAVLGLVLVIAVTQLVWQGLATGSRWLAVRAIVCAAVVSASYFTAYLVTDRVLLASVSHHAIAPSPLDAAVLGLTAVGFLGVFCLQAASGSRAAPWLRSLYVHALNGFYFDIPARRLTARVWGRITPTP